MKLTEAELKELYRRQSARSARGQAECLTEELLRRAAARELTQDERGRVIQHLRNCSDCAREYRVVHSTKEWTSQVAPSFIDQSAGTKTVETPGRRARLLAPLSNWNKIIRAPMWRAGALAAIVVIAVGASLIVWRATHHGPESIERGSPGLAMKTDPPDRAQLNEVPRRLSWSEVKPAESYQVVLYDFELTPIWESPQVKTTSVEIPDQIRAMLGQRRPVYWRVIITSGIERRQSDLFQFMSASSEQR
jgi:hypothetical protein